MKIVGKKSLAMLCAVLLLCGMCPLTAVSVSAETDGDFSYTVLEDGTAEIIGYTGAEAELMIPATLGRYTVTSIGASAFYDCSFLTSVAIPDSVTSIGAYAFKECMSIEGVYITDLAAWCGIAFGGNFAVGNYANPLSYRGKLYLNGELVTDLIIPDSVTTVREYAFEGCSSLTSVTIPDTVTSIGWSAFAGCSSLTSVTLPGGLTSIEFCMFDSCSSLQNITIPDSVTSIGHSAFMGCTSLESITIPDSVTSIGHYAFRGCLLFTSIAIPDSVTTIGYSAFGDCSLLEAVYITDLAAWCGIAFGDYSANPLYYAKNLYLNGELVTDLVIPDTVASIGWSVFRGCLPLVSVTIPESVTTIEERAFFDCTALTDIYYDGTEEQWNAVTIRSGNEALLTANIHFAETTVLLGDVNGNGEITIADAMMSFYYVNGRTSLTDTQLAASDIDGDGEITLVDAMKLFYYVNGRITVLG